MNKNWLYQKYIQEGLTIRQIGVLSGTSYYIIRTQLIKFNIPRRHAPGLGRKLTLSAKGKIAISNKGSKNGMWKGDRAGVAAGQLRARTAYLVQPCVLCGEKAEIHHNDGNTLNNEQENVEFLCRSHHMQKDGRLFNRNNRGQFTMENKDGTLQ